jgi:hypothetical protein
MKFIDPNGMEIIVGKWWQFGFKREINRMLNEIGKTDEGKRVVDHLRTAKDKNGNNIVVRILKDSGRASSTSDGNTAITVRADASGKETQQSKKDAVLGGLVTERTEGLKGLTGTGIGSSSKIYIDISGSNKQPANGTVNATLAHELYHSEDMANGQLNPNPLKGFSPTVDGLRTSEYRAVQFENVFRAKTGVDLRDTYSKDKQAGTVYSGLIPQGHDYSTGLPNNMPQ